MKQTHLPLCESKIRLISFPNDSVRPKRSRIGSVFIARLVASAGLIFVTFLTTVNISHHRYNYQHRRLELNGRRDGESDDHNLMILRDSYTAKNWGTHKPISQGATIEVNTRKSSKIAYAVTITACPGSQQNRTEPERPNFFVEDSAAVLQYSIHRNSRRGHGSGRYDYQMYAIYHPQAAACALPLADLGYTLLQRDTPVKVKDIRSQYLRENIEKGGCCGEKELIKFEAFTLTDHPVVVLLDLDVLILKPLDELFDWMLYGKRASDFHLMRPDQTVPSHVDLFHTNDYAMVNPEDKVKPAQGGFIVARPSRVIYDDILDIVREGDFHDNYGWGNQTGIFWGSMTFQGLIPYYFLFKKPGHSVELNWCIHNNMVSPAFEEDIRQGETKARCYTNEDACEDCQKRPISDLYSVHFTNCQKPWKCSRHAGRTPGNLLCRQMDHAWYKVRSEMEQSWGRSGHGNGVAWKDGSHYFGYCHGYFPKSYELIQPPYGKQFSNWTAPA